MKHTLIALTLIAALFCTTTCVAQQAVSPQAQKQQQADRALPQEGVSSASPAVSLEAVGKLVSPGIFEVSPAALHGRRLILPPASAARIICIGFWSKGSCIGIYIENDKKSTN